MGKSFDPEKHGMVMCPECKGHGKLPKGSGGAKVCSKCGGFGLIRKEEAPVGKWTNKSTV